MAFVAGHNTVIMLDDSAGTPTNISACCKSFNGFDLGSAVLDVTAFTNTAGKSILGLDSAPVVTISGTFDNTNHATIIAAKATKTDKTLKVSPAGTTSTYPYQQAEVLISNYAWTSTVDGLVDFTLTLQVNGATTTGTH